MATDDLSLLDEVFPHYDISASYSIRVRASDARVYKVLQRGIPTGAFTRLLMTLRRLPRFFQRGECSPVEQPFYRLKQLENRELVVGIIGQFWRPVATVVPINSLDEFLEFHKEGYCKAALNLRIVPSSSGECVITTETRILSFGRAKKNFAGYWQLIRPFSGIIRLEILRKIKREAESFPSSN
ncbi:MAG TPA: hypothetical protein VJ521_14775 [Acidobacteriota bacterium]|nr:hypothetical protein [Acidobacteriota bacterium]